MPVVLCVSATSKASLDLARICDSPNNHGIETGGYTEQMADRPIPLMPVNVGGQLFRGQRKVGIRQEVLNSSISRFNLIDDGIDLDAIARRQ